jgi:hypothetical protein
MMVIMNRRGDTKDSRRSSGGKAVKDYLLGKNNDRENARLLNGDPDLTTEIINGLDFKKLYTSGTLAFVHGEGDKLSEEDKQDIIDSFEQTLFPNLEPSQYSGYWVEHTDKVNDAGERRLELNFVFASVELESGKALPVYYHRNDKHLTDAWRDFTVAKYDLIDPNALDRKRVLSTVKDLPSDIKELREQLHEFIALEIENGNINNRSDMVQVLTDAGIEVARETDKSISIKNPHGTRNIRLSGAIYERAFTREKFVRENSASATKQLRPSTIDIDTARERLQYSIEKRADRFSKRFQTTDNSSIERTQQLTANADNSSRKSADAGTRISDSARYQARPSPFEIKQRKQSSHAASQHHERRTKSGHLDFWHYVSRDAISTPSSRLSPANMATIFDDFCGDIVGHWHNLRAIADASAKSGEQIDVNSRTVTTRHAQTNAADATQSSEHSLRPTRERTESFSKAVEEQLSDYAQRADDSIADATDNARRSIDTDKERMSERVRRTSRRSDIAEQTSCSLDNAIEAAKHSNTRFEQQQQIVVQLVEKQSQQSAPVSTNNNIRRFRM